jgi:RHS repeat-associated protein
VGSGVVYDGDGNRVSETAAGVTTKYLIDTLNPTGYSQVLDEIVNGAVTRKYAYGLQRISENRLIGSTWTPSFYGYDGHGNAKFLATSSGTVTDTYTYDAFGMAIASTGTTANNFRYGGEWLDPNLSFYHLHARYYNALTGRFETMDTDPGNISDPKTLHKYVDMGNNPVNTVDPTGHGILDEAILLGVGFHQFVLVPTVEGKVALAPYVAELGGSVLSAYCCDAGFFSILANRTGQPSLPEPIKELCFLWGGWKLAGR